MKRGIKLVVFLVTISALFVIFIGCNEQQPQEIKPNKKIQTWQNQDEFKKVFIELIDKIGINVYEGYDGDKKIIKIDEGVEIFEEDLKVYLHVYELVKKVEDAPTAEEIEGLYIKFDKSIYSRFYGFYEWYCLANGESTCDDYKEGLMRAYLLFKEVNGHNFNYLEDWSSSTAKDMFEMEEYVSNNPDYSATSPSYNKLLNWLGLKE